MWTTVYVQTDSLYTIYIYSNNFGLALYLTGYEPKLRYQYTNQVYQQREPTFDTTYTDSSEQFTTGE